LIAQGLKAPQFPVSPQAAGRRSRSFDFTHIADVTGHPYRVQSEQSKLTRILLDQLRDQPNFQIEFDSPVRNVTQDDASVEIAIERHGRIAKHCGRWLIGADGARSDVRRSLGIEFVGFTCRNGFGREHAVRLRNVIPGWFGEPCGRSAALHFCCRSRPLSRDARFHRGEGRTSAKF
jgi:2-polyprenyl-6-methoxyphenol hydroxylase-like FAD-dependent oxidoreductase